jgi:hypothetical protein
MLDYLGTKGGLGVTSLFASCTHLASNIRARSSSNFITVSNGFSLKTRISEKATMDLLTPLQPHRSSNLVLAWRLFAHLVERRSPSVLHLLPGAKKQPRPRQHDSE